MTERTCDLPSPRPATDGPRPATDGAKHPPIEPGARVTPAWLALREPADAAARAAQLVESVRDRTAGSGRLVVHDLGCGTGSMGRWLAPQLSGPQHWIMYDRDPDLLEHAAATMAGAAADGAPVTVETRRADITRLTADGLAGAGLITASALLDMLTAEELERIVAACCAARCPTLLTISVAGRVELTPPDPLDAEIAEAFNDHQRRTTGGRRLLGPDAVDAAADGFNRRGARVLIAASPWRLGAEQVELVSEWFAGWVDAACEQRPELTGPLAAYSQRRRVEAAQGRLEVVVQHRDLLASFD